MSRREDEAYEEGQKDIELRMPKIKSNTWYERHWKNKETEEFNLWWENYYNSIESYLDIEDSKEEANEYKKRKAFALMGWLGRGGELK